MSTSGPRAAPAPTGRASGSLDHVTGHRVHVEVGPAPEPDLPDVDGLLAGAAEVDITPPPGMPKAGHSRNAQDGTGFRTRLRGRVLHLRSGTTSLALVQCDLMGGSAIVHRLVADEIAADTDVRLPGLFMGATHTHAGPGQYCSNDFNNRFASNRPGFDPAYTHFLVTQLAAAVRRAVAERRPGRLAFGSTEVWGLTRNRSLEPHLENRTVTDKRRVPQRKYSAVNPWLHLLRVDGDLPDGGHAPMAAMVVFSIHGTGISQHDPAYNADVWAYLTGELGHRIERAHGTRPVVGAVEGTHGDVAPAVRPGMLVYPETERVGRGIGQAAADLFERLEGDLSPTVTLAAGLREVDLRTDPAVDGISLPPPAVGAACLAGAYENTTPVLNRIPPFRAGWPRRVPRGPHGAKRVVGGRWLQPLIVPTESFARVLPFQVLRIGDRAIVAVPFEVTVESGRRIEAAVHRAVGPGSGVARVVVSSLANEQLHYLTTPEEYGRQYYEGGNTVLGPRSQEFAAAHVAHLASDVLRTGHVADHRPTARFDLRVRRYLAEPEPGDARAGERSLRGVPTFTDPTATEDGYWEQEWRDVSPGALAWHEPMARVEAQDTGGGWAPASRHGRAVDDQGWYLSVVHLGPDPGGGHRYAARWYDPAVGGGRPHRMVLVANAGRAELAGRPFE